jgi:hypothetical protein
VLPRPGQNADYIPGGTVPVLMGRNKSAVRELFFTMQAEHFDRKQGGTLAAPGLTGLAGGNWVCYEKVDLDEGANRFVIRLAAAQVDPTSAIEVRLDSLTAPAVAVVKVQPTPDWSIYHTLSAPLAAVTGKHDVYLTFTGSDRVADIDWFKFIRTPRNAAAQIAGNSYDDARGVNDHSNVVANIDRGDYLRYSQLDFGDGLEVFEGARRPIRTGNLRSASTRLMGR